LKSLSLFQKKKCGRQDTTESVTQWVPVKMPGGGGINPKDRLIVKYMDDKQPLADM